MFESLKKLFGRKEKPEKKILTFYNEYREILNCPECKIAQQECKWKGSILDHIAYDFYPNNGVPLYKKYSLNSNFQMCDMHKKLFLEK